MRKELLIILALVLAGMIYFYSKDNEVSFQKPNITTVDSTDAAESTESAPQEKFVAAEPAVNLADQATVISEANQDQIFIETAFAGHLKSMNQCLQIKNQADQEQTVPSFEQLQNSLKPAIGEMSVFTDDWQQTDLKYSDGISRRIRTEINYEDEVNPKKYLYVYKMNDQGLPELEPLDEDKTINPTDDFISSLEAGADITIKEKGGRAYFQGGEELIVIEKNNMLESFTMSKNNKTFSCSSLSNKESNCQCF